MDANRKQPYGLPRAGHWVEKNDPFYRTYTKGSISAYETYGEWLERMNNNPSHFEVSSKTCVPGGYQNRGSAPAVPFPLAPPLPMRDCMKTVGDYGGVKRVNHEKCSDCYPDVMLPNYDGGIRHRRSVPLPTSKESNITVFGC